MKTGSIRILPKAMWDELNAIGTTRFAHSFSLGKKDHRGNRAHPIEVGGHDPVFGTGRRHADDFLGSEVGGKEGLGT
ncbi:MAG: hypothetical protein ABIT37_12310 [Luteolibacter sp.]